MHKTRLRQQDGFVLYFYFLGVAALFFLTANPSRTEIKTPPGGKGGEPLRGGGGYGKRETFYGALKIV